MLLTAGQWVTVAQSLPPPTAALPGGRKIRVRQLSFLVSGFVDRSHGWAVGDDTSTTGASVILVTTDGGVTWSAQDPGTTSFLSGISFADPSHGWAVGVDPSTRSSVILGTTDGGATWGAQDPGTTPGLNAVTCSDASHGWAVGDNGTILATADGGATWNVQHGFGPDAKDLGYRKHAPWCLFR